MSGFVRSSQRYRRYHHQPLLTKRLTTISLIPPTGHTRHSPRSSSSSRPLRALRAFAVSLVRPKAASSVFSAFYPNVRKCPVLSGLLNAIPATAINPLCQQDLQQFASCIRPDIPDIRPAAELSRLRSPRFLKCHPLSSHRRFHCNRLRQHQLTRKTIPRRCDIDRPSAQS